MAEHGNVPRKKSDNEPWKPTPWEDADLGAIQAMSRGEATPEQQVRALKYIVEGLSGAYELSYRVGPDGDRNTAFAEGKRWVGLQIIKLTKLNLQQLRRRE